MVDPAEELVTARVDPSVLMEILLDESAKLPHLDRHGLLMKVSAQVIDQLLMKLVLRSAKPTKKTTAP